MKDDMEEVIKRDNDINSGRKRVLWIDLIKICGTFLIVVQHSISHGWVSACGQEGIAWAVLNLVFMLTRIGVPVFFMCSGAMMLRKDRSVREVYTYNIPGLIKTYICWMLLFGLIESLQLTEPSPRIVINVFLKAVLFGRYHTWFILTLTGLYAITPLLRKIVADKGSMEYFLILSVLFTVIFPVIGQVDLLARAYEVIGNINMRFVVGYVLYYVLGYYLSVLELRPPMRASSVLAFIVSAISAYLISGHMAVTVGTECQRVYLEFSPLGFLMSVSGYCAFRGIFEKKVSRCGKAIAQVASVGIGIYLFHPILLPLLGGREGLWCLLNGVALYGISLALMLIIARIPVLKQLFLNIYSQPH